MKDDVKKAIESIHAMLVELSGKVFPERSVIIRDDSTRIGYISLKTTPKPLLADAKAEWVCRLRNGSYIQLERYVNPPVRDYVNPIDRDDSYWVADNEEAYYLNGRHSKDITEPIDIVSCEPLAPEGSAEWAWQMMALGKIVIPRSLPGSLAYGCSATANTLLGQKCRYWTNHKSEFMERCADITWKLYEPESSPFKVGDWVTDGVVTGYITRWGMGMAWIRTQDKAEYHLDLSNLRKLDPSEVRVKITLEGTVNKGDGQGYFRLQYGDGENDYSVIDYDQLDPDVARLVQELVGP